MEKNFTQTYKITSKEFWRNYWFYYKPHTIWGIIILIFIIGSVHSCVTRIDPDVTIMYIGETPLITSEEYSVGDVLGAYVNDVDGDGNNSATLINLAYGSSADPQMTQASVTKFDIEIAEGNPFIAMFDDSIKDRYVNEDVFVPIDDMTAEYNIPEERILYDDEGKVVAVNVTGTSFGDIIGTIDGIPAYAALKFIPERKIGDEEYTALYNEATEFYRKILADEMTIPQAE